MNYGLRFCVKAATEAATLPIREKCDICLLLCILKYATMPFVDAEWSSPVARRAHNPKVVGSNPASARLDLLAKRLG